jgi:hypothetical protein
MAGEAPAYCHRAEKVSYFGTAIMLGVRYLFRVWATVALFAAIATGTAQAAPGNEPTVEGLKAKLSTTSVGDKPHVCVQIAQKQLKEADKFYAAADVEKGQAALVDVVAYSELARDYAIQSHKYQKQAEIAVRAMTRKLTELTHTVDHDDQAPVKDAISRLQQVEDDLLKAMFPKGAK